MMSDFSWILLFSPLIEAVQKQTESPLKIIVCPHIKKNRAFISKCCLPKEKSTASFWETTPSFKNECPTLEKST